jgi:hypothetical protein
VEIEFYVNLSLKGFMELKKITLKMDISIDNTIVNIRKLK